jgi:hypothetical protein
MLIIDRDECGITMYMVCNDAGSCLIRTADGYIAHYIHYLSKGIDTNLRLTVGGDPGTRQATHPVFHHVRRYSR